MTQLVVEPRVKGFICTTAHPLGCEENVKQQIALVKSRGKIFNGPKSVLVIGASAGYGLASRIVAAFGSGAATLGIGYERAADLEKGRTATGGWYQTKAFDRLAHEEGLFAQSLNGDAFSSEMKKNVINIVKKNMPPLDLIIYSLAAPRRTDPITGESYRSCLKAVGAPVINKTLDVNSGIVSEITLESCTEEEIQQTTAVMGGEDWRLWIEALEKEDLLAKGCITLAYSYVGPEVTKPIYRQGTIGRAKDHLEKTARELSLRLQTTLGGQAFISVNKALVTQASSAIPFMPLYISMLYKVMKEKNLHEGCIEQMDRMFRERLYCLTGICCDKTYRIRMDDWEMRPEIQEEMEKRWNAVSTENVNEICDVEGYRSDFLKLFGFGFKTVDYQVPVSI